MKIGVESSKLFPTQHRKPKESSTREVSSTDTHVYHSWHFLVVGLYVYVASATERQNGILIACYIIYIVEEGRKWQEESYTRAQIVLRI